MFAQTISQEEKALMVQLEKTIGEIELSEIRKPVNKISGWLSKVLKREIGNFRTTWKASLLNTSILITLKPSDEYPEKEEIRLKTTIISSTEVSAIKQLLELIRNPQFILPLGQRISFIKMLENEQAEIIFEFQQSKEGEIKKFLPPRYLDNAWSLKCK